MTRWQRKRLHRSNALRSNARRSSFIVHRSSFIVQSAIYNALTRAIMPPFHVCSGGNHMAADLLGSLNQAQQKAVRALDGPVLVLAGPGSGKTRVLTHRIAYLIGVAGVNPYSILAVTFTNKAAREMKERLDALLGAGRAAALTVGTFHSICTRFLRRDIVHLGRERDFAIYDSDDQLRLMRRVLKDLDLDEKKYAPRAIHANISRAKNELVDPEEYA